uniref:non-specific serine/threonine protein kinase n=1 Tax=Setaria italica TaxID=4555 RepID=K4A2P1_SETIT
MEHLPMAFLVAFFLLCLSLNNLPGFCVAGGDSFAFSGFAGANLTRDGTAKITREGLLELTNNDAHVQGHAFHPTPVQFKDSPNGTVQSFSLIFVFAILSDPAYSYMSSDGMAFVIAPGKDFSSASPAQYLGLLNSQSTGPANASNHIFAVELDTIQNEEFKDINGNHVGIDINTLSSVYSHPAAFYDDKDVITEKAYVGFSAATGPIKSRHYVLAWSFAMNGPAPAIDFKKMPKLPNPDHKTPAKALEIALPIAAFVILAICIAVLVIVQTKLAYAELREDWEVEFGPHRFSYKELYDATEGFKSKHLLGVGGFGKVYKGILSKSKSEVAVKRVSHDSSQGIKEFVSEVVSIGHLRHRNLVQLLGYCRRKGELLLVYDYMPNGSLDKYLYGEDNRPILEWAQRFQIIKDVASGLFYLHEKWEQVVIHRDIKASNVLLDGGMIAHLGDFGLARLYDHGTDLQTTHVVGTMGYIAPELSRTGKASPLTDVFAFGTFLLEVTCGRRPVSNSVQHGRALLVDRVLEYWHRGALEETVDSRLQGNYNIDEARMVLTLGLMCSHPFPSERPTMRQVMQYLDGDVPLPELIPANMSLLSLMRNQVSFDQSVLQYPWSATSIGTMTAGISVGR